MAADDSKHRRERPIPELWSGSVLLGILGFALNAVPLAVERRVLAWHGDARRAAA